MDAEGARDELSAGQEPKGAEAALREADREDAVAALERKLSTVVVLAVLFVLLVIWALFEMTAPGPALALVVVSMLTLKRAVMEYRSLEEKRAELLEGGEGTLAAGEKAQGR